MRKLLNPINQRSELKLNSTVHNYLTKFQLVNSKNIATHSFIILYSYAQLRSLALMSTVNKILDVVNTSCNYVGTFMYTGHTHL